MAGQFPGFIPLQFAQAPDYSKAFGGIAAGAKPLAQAAGQSIAAGMPGTSIPGAVGPTSVGGPNGPAPLQSGPPTLLQALKNMSPAQIMASLQTVSDPSNVSPMQAPPMQQATDPSMSAMQPGAAIFQGAGMH